MLDAEGSELTRCPVDWLREPDPERWADVAVKVDLPMNRADLLHPINLARRIRYKLYERRHPDEPWISQGAIGFLCERLPRDGAGLEWGSGRSTAWFGARLGSLVSVEHDEQWHAIVAEKVAGMGSVDLRHIAVEHPLDEPTVPTYDPVPAYVRVVDEFADASLDFALVDGHYRQACILAVLDKLRPGGLLVVDNTDWLPEDEWGVPLTWPLVHRSRNVMTETSVWGKP